MKVHYQVWKIPPLVPKLNKLNLLRGFLYMVIRSLMGDTSGSENHNDSIFKVHISTKKSSEYSSEMLEPIYRSTRCESPEDQSMKCHNHENMNSHREIQFTIPAPIPLTQNKCLICKTCGSHSGGYEENFFWGITPCSPLKVNWGFGGTCRFHLESRISRARYQRESR
jgi:hypothetical protein